LGTEVKVYVFLNCDFCSAMNELIRSASFLIMATKGRFDAPKSNEKSIHAL